MVGTAERQAAKVPHHVKSSARPHPSAVGAALEPQSLRVAAVVAARAWAAMPTRRRPRPRLPGPGTAARSPGPVGLPQAGVYLSPALTTSPTITMLAGLLPY